jgi:hypothetical protein
MLLVLMIEDAIVESPPMIRNAWHSLTAVQGGDSKNADGNASPSVGLGERRECWKVVILVVVVIVNRRFRRLMIHL